MSEPKLDGYTLTRQWFDFAFENPRLVKPVHGIVYLWCVEKNNRLGWVKEFQLPTDEGMAAAGVKDKETFLKALKDLAFWGAIRIVQESKNIYTARYITLKGCKLVNDGSLDNVLSRPKKPDAKPNAEPAATPDAKPARKVTAKPSSPPTNNKPKTPKPKKPKTVPAKPASNTKLYNEAKKIFIAVHLEKCQSGEYYFQAVDGKKITSLIEKITFKVKERQPGKVDFTLQEMSDAFLYFFTMAYDSGNEWLKSNFTLSNLDAQFNPVYTNIKNYANKTNKANGSGNGKAASPDGIIDAINKRYNPGPDTNNG